MSKWLVRQLDENLNPVGVLGNVRSIKIDRCATDSVPLLESCSIEFDIDKGFTAGWYRIERIGSVRSLRGCFRLELDSTSVDYGVITATAKGYSVLKPAAEVYLPNGSYISAGTDGAAYVSRLLCVCPCETSIAAGNATTQSSIVFGDDTSYLEAAWEVLDALGWCLRISGNGAVAIMPRPSTVQKTIAANDSGTIPGLSVGDKISYTCEYAENVRPFDLVAIEMPRYGVDGTYSVLSQSESSDVSDTVSETLGELER